MQKQSIHIYTTVLLLGNHLMHKVIIVASHWSVGSVHIKNSDVRILCLFQAKPVNKDRFISKMFLRGDSVILVLRNPLATAGAK
jgi:hypothetical protein